jgi:hypothetical protein
MVGTKIRFRRVIFIISIGSRQATVSLIGTFARCLNRSFRQNQEDSKADPADWISYRDREKSFGEAAAFRWVPGKYGKK